MLRATLLLFLLCLPPLLPAQKPPADQSPRQIFQEVVFSRDPEALLQRLPSYVLRQLAANPDLATDWVARLRDPKGDRGDKLEMFPAGRLLAAVTSEDGTKRIEFAIDKEEVSTDDAEMELVVRRFKEGQEDADLWLPHLVVRLRLEEGTWRLVELGRGVRMRLSDPKEVEAAFRQAAARKPARNEASAVGSVRTINTAQVTYAATYPDVGFTCRLANLDGANTDGEANQNRAMLIDSALGNGTRSGYLFTLRGCAGTPAVSFQVAAQPEVFGQTGKRAFCSDESGVIRFSDDGSAESCLARGEPLQ